MYDNTGALHFFLNDHLGSARMVIDSTGVVKDRYKRYFAYGGGASQTVSTGQKYQYTGQPYDDDSAFDLYYYGARYYDPVIGRFTSRDPKAQKYPELSPFVYAGDNPLKYIDPNGTENEFALDWARNNMLGKSIPFGQWYGSKEDGWTSQKGVVPKQAYCYESGFIAYMNSGDKIRDYLQKSGFSGKSGAFMGRAHGMAWFESGGKDRSFVTNPTKGEAGDMIFMGNAGEMEGHSALLIFSVQNKDSTITLNTLSVLAEGGYYGEKQYILTKDKDGNWVANNGQMFRGYGQMHNTNELQPPLKTKE